MCADMYKKSKAEEVENNYDFFSKIEQDLINEHSGKYALLRSQEIVKIYDSILEAHTHGVKKFTDGLYSIQKIGRRPVELGFFRYAIDNGAS